jgi:tetratricopeptide (TPR) repeat protein
MPRRIVAAFFFLSLCFSYAGAAGIDDDFVKPGNGTWGDILDRTLGQKGFGKSYAVVIGIGDYEHYQKLSAPAADAVQVRNFLRDEAQFDRIITLTDEKATRARIENLMERILPQLVQRNDRLLFYFSGHGITRSLAASKRGYLILRSSSRNGWDEMIDMPRMREWSENFGHARHVLFLLDACFSGLAASERKAGFDPRSQTIQRLMQPASHIVTAGIEGEQSYIFNEKSLFTAAFLAAARGSLSMPNDGVISLSEMMVQINRALDAKRAELNEKFRMTPRSYYSRIENNGGEFFFLANTAAQTNRSAPPVNSSLESKGNTDQTSPQTLVNRGIDYFNRNEIDSAIAEYNEAIRRDPNNARVLYRRGDAYRTKSDFDRAIADYSEAIRLNSKDTYALYNRGVSYKNKQDYDHAIADYSEVIRLDPKDPDPLVARGNVYMIRKDYDRAIADYSAAVRLDSKNALALLGRGNAYRTLKNYDQAIADYNASIRLNANSASAFYNRGVTYRNKQDYDRAVTDYNAAMRLNPKDPDPLIARGNVYLIKKDYDRAIADYSAAIGLDSKNALAFSNRADAYRYMKNYDRAIDDYNELIRLDSKNAEAFYYRGRSKQMKGDASGGASDIARAKQLDPAVGN